jgi:hypothetical protein
MSLRARAAIAVGAVVFVALAAVAAVIYPASARTCAVSAQLPGSGAGTGR